MTKNYSSQLAKIALDIGAIVIRPNDPFEWASGYMMPMYNDNRKLLRKAKYRALIAESFEQVIAKQQIPVEVIAGVATAGIPHATTLADRLGLQLVYVRDKPKDHGMRNQIEGIGADETLEGKATLVVEDLISTGGSSVKAVKAAREANGRVSHLFSIFSYGFEEAAGLFRKAGCIIHSSLTYETLLEVAKRDGQISAQDVIMLDEWRADPFNWGAKNGFPKKEK